MVLLFPRPCPRTEAHLPHQWRPPRDIFNAVDCPGLSRDIAPENAVTDDRPGPRLEES